MSQARLDRLGLRRRPCRHRVRGAALRAALPALLALLLVPLAAGPAAAEPVRTVLVDDGWSGARAFAEDLRVLWRHRYEPTPERLALRTVAPPEARLRALQRRRGDFAVVDAATAAERLADYDRVTAVAVLWPNLLHALSRNRRVREVALPPAVETWVFDNAPRVHAVLRALAGGGDGAGRLHLVPARVLPDALAYADEPLLLASLPVPAAPLSEALARRGNLRLVPFPGGLLEELKLEAPWLLTGKMGRGTYAGQGKNLELPAVYQLMLGRKELPAATVRKMLRTVYRRPGAMALFNPLFDRLSGNMNEVFGKLVSFHPATAERFDFTPAVP